MVNSNILMRQIWYTIANTLNYLSILARVYVCNVAKKLLNVCMKKI